MNGPVIEHWLVTVARAAGYPVQELHVLSETPPTEAWDLVTLGAGVATDALVGKVAEHFGLERADLEARDAHAARLLPARVARRLGVVPLRHTDRALFVASADPVGMEAEREIAALAGRAVHFEVAAPRAIAAVLAATYPDADEAPHELPRLAADERAGPHVLVVDDDADARALLRGALEGRGFQVSEAEDGGDALRALETGGTPVHLVTLDLQMRAMNGLETLRRIRGGLATAHLPVIVATGADDPSVEMELFEAGADDYVVKPIDPPRFVLRVQAVLRRRGGLQPALPV